jgi:hypothetical protein
MPNIFDLLGGRKFVLSLITIAVGSVVFLKTGGISTELVALLVGVLTAFSAANAMTTVKTVGLEAREEGAPEAAANPELTTQFETLTAQQQQLSNDLMVMTAAIETMHKTLETTSQVARTALQTATRK